MAVRPLLFCAAIPLFLVAGSAFATNFGALAYDRNSDSWGASYNYPSQAAANGRALSLCGSKCAVVVEFYNNCASYAVGTGDSWGFGHDIDRRAAQQRAIAECGKHGKECQIKMTACNSAPDSGSNTPHYTPEPRPSHSCWYRNGGRVPYCKD